MNETYLVRLHTSDFEIYTYFIDAEDPQTACKKATRRFSYYELNSRITSIDVYNAVTGNQIATY